MWFGRIFLVLLCKQERFTKINRSVGSVLEFQQNEPQNQHKIVTPMNNKVAAISKMNYLVVNNLVLESKFLT